MPDSPQPPMMLHFGNLASDDTSVSDGITLLLVIALIGMLAQGEALPGQLFLVGDATHEGRDDRLTDDVAKARIFQAVGVDIDQVKDV